MQTLTYEIMLKSQEFTHHLVTFDLHVHPVTSIIII